MLDETPLEIQILEEEIRRLELELNPPGPVETRNELLTSRYVEQRQVHSGPDYLEVRASLWTVPYLSIENRVLNSLDEARSLARKQGFMGIYVTFGGRHG